MDHLSACCTVCWKRMHKVCHVISIEHAVRIVHKSRITLDLEHKIDYLLVKVKDTLQERKDLLVDIEKQRNISMNSVKTFRKSLDNYINSLQANLELDIENHFCQAKKQLDKEIHDFFQKLMKSIIEFSQPIQSLSELTDIRQQCSEMEESIGQSFFQMKNIRLSVSFISIQQIAHVISKIGSTLITETSRTLNESNRSRCSSYNSHSSRRSTHH